MKKITKLLTIAFLFIGLFVVAACSSTSGVNATIEAKSTPTSIKLNIQFGENSNLSSKKAKPHVKKYTYDDEGSTTFSSDIELTFSDDNYTQSTYTFTGLNKNTKYKFILFVTFNSYDEEITSIDASTSNIGETEDNPIEITSVSDFKAMSDNRDAYYKLANDLDFRNEGLGAIFTKDKPFEGHFDGNGKTISNVKLNATTYVGLFNVCDGAEIKNLVIENVKADLSTSSTFVGALSAQITNSKVTDVTINDVELIFNASSSTADYNIGGVIGSASDTTFNNVKANNVDMSLASVKGAKVYTGMFAGKTLGDPSKLVVKEGEPEVSTLAYNCGVEGRLFVKLEYKTTSEGFVCIGGFIGNDGSSGIITDSYVNSRVTVIKDTTSTTSNYNYYSLAVGGFVGGNSEGNGMNIDNVLALVDVKVYAGNESTVQADIDDLNDTLMNTKTTYVGGLVGIAYKTITKIENSFVKFKTIDNVIAYLKEYKEAKASDVKDTNYQNYFIKDASDNYVVPTSYDENETYYEKVRFVDNKIGTLKDNVSKVNNIYLNDEINTTLMAKNIKAYYESLNI